MAGQQLDAFTYFGTNTGTSQLPIMLAYINTHANFDPTNPARYNSTLFSNSTLVTQLSTNGPSFIAFANNIENGDRVVPMLLQTVCRAISSTLTARL